MSETKFETEDRETLRRFLEAYGERLLLQVLAELIRQSALQLALDSDRDLMNVRHDYLYDLSNELRTLVSE